MLAEWEASSATLLNIYELKQCGKLKHAHITQEHIVTYDIQQQALKVFDLQTKALLHTIKEQEKIYGSVN